MLPKSYLSLKCHFRIIIGHIFGLKIGAVNIIVLINTEEINDIARDCQQITYMFQVENVVFVKY